MLMSLELPSIADDRAGAPALTVIINNYNYARYLPAAIESVLSQDVPCELIVVDDCSTDNSRDVILSYGDRVIPVFQPVNGGQGAGFNAGFAESHGDLVMYLDADDFLLPGAAARIVANRKPGVSLYLYRMRYADEAGALAGVHPGRGFSQGDFSQLLRMRGRYDGTVTSGMVLDRAAMERYMPVDSAAFRYGGDGYIASAAPLYGDVSCEMDIISAYRLHGAQHTNPGIEALAKRARWRMEHDQARYAVIREHSARLGLPVAADLGTQDTYNVKERLISLMFGPELHPFPEDSQQALLARCRQLTLSQERGVYRFLRAGWWTLLAVLPVPMRRNLFRYELDASVRPGWMRGLARLLRGRR